MRVETLKSCEISPVGCEPWSGSLSCSLIYQRMNTDHRNIETENTASAVVTAAQGGIR